MRRILEWLTVAAVLLGTATGSRAADETRRTVKDDAPRIALVIGNTNYTKLTRLGNPGNDARLMSQKLRQLGFEVVKSFDRDLAGLSKDVEAFARKIKQRGRDTVSAVFYAGHGLENDSVNYLVPVNADIKKRAESAARR